MNEYHVNIRIKGEETLGRGKGEGEFLEIDKVRTCTLVPSLLTRIVFFQREYS